MFDLCTTGDTAHIDTIFKLLLHTLTRVWNNLNIKGFELLLVLVLTFCRSKEGFITLRLFIG